MMDIGFVITANIREHYLPQCLRAIKSYQRIHPKIAVCYNGNQSSFPCDVRLVNKGHQHGDLDLTVNGLAHLIQRGAQRRFIKIGVDTLLLNESVLMNIFWEMERNMCCYAGNRWGSEQEPSYATDIIFLDTQYGNPFDRLNSEDGASFEWWMFNAIKNASMKALIIPERVPVHPRNRMECAALHWTMHHQFDNNVENMRKWGYGSLII
jgi:hypothetical protein